MASARILARLRDQLTPQQWRLLLKAGLCIGCQLAMREVSSVEETDPEDEDDEEEDLGRPFPEERE